jgi:hypothetical protein
MGGPSAMSILPVLVQPIALPFTTIPTRCLNPRSLSGCCSSEPTVRHMHTVPHLLPHTPQTRRGRLATHNTVLWFDNPPPCSVHAWPAAQDQESAPMQLSAYLLLPKTMHLLGSCSQGRAA